MKVKVLPNELAPGMYVVELDMPWEEAPFEPPFELQGFTVSSFDDIQSVRRNCKFVFIDPTLSTGDSVEKYLAAGHEVEESIKEVAQAETLELADRVYPDVATIEEEIQNARQIEKDTRAVYDKILKDVNAGNAIDGVAVKKTVKNLVSSIVRNPDALMWLVQLRNRDEMSYAHAMSTSVMGLTFGRFLGLPEDDLNIVGAATLLQDIGKMQLPEDLLSKVGPLAAPERELLKKHVDASLAMLGASHGQFDPRVLEVVQRHHERFDGTGYPHGLKETDIDMLSSMSGMVDTYVAMTSDRPYRDARTSFDVLMYIYGLRNQKFSGALVEQFIQCIGIFPVGSFVSLSSGEIGIVVTRNRVLQLKPKVMIVIDRDGTRLERPKTLDLARQPLQPSRVQQIIADVVDPEEYGLNPEEFFL